VLNRLTQPIGVRNCRRMVGRSLIGLTLSFVTHPRLVGAVPLSLRITTERTESASDCADRDELYRKVRQVSQRALVTEQPAQNSVLVTARFDKRGEEYLAELRFGGAKPGERRFRDRGSDCRSLEDAIAVAIVLLLDTEIEQRERALEVVRHSEPTISLTSGEVRVRGLTRADTEGTVAIKGGPLWGATETTAASFALELGLRLRSAWQFEVGAWALWPRTVSYGKGEVTVSLVSAEVRGCRTWGEVLLFGACVAPALGRLHGTGRGFDESASANLVWVAVGGAVTLEVPLGRRWFGGLEGAAWVPLSHQTLSVTNLGTAWNSAAIWGGLAARLGVRFR
jgi:hypothetical protein